MVMVKKNKRKGIGCHAKGSNIKHLTVKGYIGIKNIENILFNLHDDKHKTNRLINIMESKVATNFKPSKALKPYERKNRI